jgi:putative salt-induced outer membrane protein YdiY
VTGETWKRRIAGIEAGVLQLDGDVPSLPLANLSRINPPAVEPPKWTGSLTLSGLFSDGNTERRSVGAAFEASRRTDMDRITTDGVWDYAEDRSTAGGDWDLTQRRAGAGLKYDYLLGKRWYALTTARVLGDTFADLDLRFTGGAGLGYTVIDIDTTTLLTEAGLSYFNENYRSATPSTDYVAARVAYKVNHKLSEATKLAHGVEAFPSLESADDVYFQMKTEVVTTVAEGMIASLGWVWDYDNTPSPGLERSDHRVLLSIGWSF